MSVDQFYLLLFGLSVFGGLSLVLLVEVCKLRKFADGLLVISNNHRREIVRLQRAEAIQNRDSARIEDLQAIASVHWEAFAKVAERLKRVESSHFFLVRKPPEVVGEPGEVHPFAVDAFVTVPTESAAA